MTRLQPHISRRVVLTLPTRSGFKSGPRSDAPDFIVRILHLERGNSGESFEETLLVSNWLLTMSLILGIENFVLYTTALSLKQ